MKKKFLAILAALVVFAIGVFLIVFFDAKNTFTMILLAAATVGTYKSIANSDKNDNESDSAKE